MLPKPIVIDFKQVSIFQASYLVLDNLQFSVVEGEWFYILGPNGSGKTSLLKTIFGDLPLHHGHGQVLGQALRGINRDTLAALRRRLGWVAVDWPLIPHLSLEENWDFILEATDWQEREQRQMRLEHIFKLLPLDAARHKFPAQLQRGELLWAAIGRALLNQPSLLLMDDIVGSLEKPVAQSILQFLHRYTREHGLTVIFATANREWPTIYAGTALDLVQLSSANKSTSAPIG